MLYVSVLVYGENIFFAKMLQNPHTRKALVQFNSEMGLTWLIASFGFFFLYIRMVRRLIIMLNITITYTWRNKKRRIPSSEIMC